MGLIHGDDPHEHPPAPAARCASASAGPVGSGKTALVAALCRALGDRLSIGVVTNDIYTTEDARLPAPQRRPARRADRRRPDRLLPAHRDPRRHHRQPRRRRRPRRAARRPRPGARRVRRRQPHGVVQQGPGRRPDLRRRRRRRRQGAAQGRPRRDRRRPAGDQQDRPRADGRRRPDVMDVDADRVRGERPVLLVSLRDDPAAGPVVDWLLGAELDAPPARAPAADGAARSRPRARA